MDEDFCSDIPRSVRGEKMADLEIITKNILVISWENEFPQDVWEELFHRPESPDDTHLYHKIYLKPESYYAKTLEWLAQRGVKWDGKNDSEYVLWEL